MRVKSCSALLLCLYLAKNLHLAHSFRSTTVCAFSSLSKLQMPPKGKRALPATSTDLSVSPVKATVADAVVVESPSSPKKRKKATEGEPTSPVGDSKAPHIRDSIQPVPLDSSQRYLKIISWNVNGLKAVISGKKEIFDRLVSRHNPDILCLQETKLQENLVDEYRNLLDGYDSYWSCSTVKKGYSGTVSYSSSFILSHE